MREVKVARFGIRAGTRMQRHSQSPDSAFWRNLVLATDDLVSAFAHAVRSAVEMADLVALFTLGQSEQENLRNWKLGARECSPIWSIESIRPRRRKCGRQATPSPPRRCWREWSCPASGPSRFWALGPGFTRVTLSSDCPGEFGSGMLERLHRRLLHAT